EDAKIAEKIQISCCLCGLRGFFLFAPPSVIPERRFFSASFAVSAVSFLIAPASVIREERVALRPLRSPRFLLDRPGQCDRIYRSETARPLAGTACASAIVAQPVAHALIH